MNNFGYHPPIQPGDPYQNRGREMYPREPIQPSVQPMQQQAPTLQINVRFDKNAPNVPIIEPTKQSVKALANWYRQNGVTEQQMSISGARIGNTELPPLFTQMQDFDEEGFRAWADKVIGPSAITMSDNREPGDNWDNIELDILRKVYGNMRLIEKTRHLKEEKDITTGSIRNLNKMRLEQKLQDILDERFGKPLEFEQDIDELTRRINNSKEYGNLGEEAIDYMFGCIIEAHILGAGKRIIMVDGTPKVESGDVAENAQWKGIFETTPFRKKDGIWKIADYMAAHTYHNVNKDLGDYYGDLSNTIIGASPDIKLTAERIDKSNLSPKEKSFMSLWMNETVKLGERQAGQDEYVERANENAKKASPETIKRDFHRDAIGTLAKINPLLGAGVFVGLFGGLLAMIWGKDSKLAKFMLTIAAGLGIGGVAMAGPSMLRNFQKNILDNGNAITQAPRRTQNTGNALTDAAHEMPDFFKDKWNNVSAFFSTSSDWSGLMLDERIGPKLVDKYPTGAILAVLNPDPDNEFNEKWKGTPTQEAEIKKILEKLDGDEKKKLNMMLTETWDKYINANILTLNNAQLKNGTIQDMVESLNTEYSWFHTRRISYLFDDESTKETLIEFTRDPTGWKNAKIGDIMVEQFSSARNDLPVGRVVPSSMTKLISNTTHIESVNLTIQKIWEANSPCDPDKTLGQLLAK